MNARALPFAVAAAAAAAGILLAGSAHAQTGREFCDELFTELTVGEYAEWRFDLEGQRVMNLSMAVVAKEMRDGHELYWLEMTLPLPAGNVNVAAQMLVPGFPFDEDEMVDYIIQYGDQPPMRVPANEMGSMPASGWREQCRSADAEYMGIEKVTVEGVGTFDAHHVKTSGETPGHWYFSSEVPFAMLKFEAAEGNMIVTKIGTDYSGKIDRAAAK